MSFLKDTLIVLRKEILCFIRDKNIVIYSIVLPIFLYPMTFWVMNQIMLLQRGAVENQVSKISVVHAELAPELYSLLDTDEMLEVTDDNNPLGRSDGVQAKLIIDDAFLDVMRPCFKFTIEYDQADEYSVVAKQRIEEAVSEFRDLILLLVGIDYDMPDDVVEPFTIDAVNIASDKQMGAFIIGRLLPMMIIIMAAMGTFHPAIDVVVGERERKTIETTLLVPTSRFALVLGKFISVVLAGIVAVILNIVALGVTASHTLFLMRGDEAAVFSIPLRSIPLVFITTVIIAAGFSATCILIASYAKTFREGQSYVTPFFIISFQPAIISALPGITLTTGIALIPIANAALMFREVIENTYRWDKIIIVLLSLTIYTTVVLVAAARRLKNENTFWGEKSESVKKKQQFWERLSLWRKS